MNIKRYKPFLNQQGGRYVPSMDCPSMKEDDRGEWVSLADYARLKAEVERLTKAGDAMALALAIGDRSEYGGVSDPIEDYLKARKEIQAWNAAKEGKQP